MSAIQRFLKYGIKGGNTWYIVVCPLYGVSAKRGFTDIVDYHNNKD